jgi:hypothetical protein
MVNVPAAPADPLKSQPVDDLSFVSSEPARHPSVIPDGIAAVNFTQSRGELNTRQLV